MYFPCTQVPLFRILQWLQGGYFTFFFTCEFEDFLQVRRLPYESLPLSHTGEMYLRSSASWGCSVLPAVCSYMALVVCCKGMIGCGRANVAQIADLARANVADSVPSKALEAFASLGAGGKFPGNQERDLHRWVNKLYGVSLSPYCVETELSEPWIEFIIFGGACFLL